MREMTVEQATDMMLHVCDAIIGQKQYLAEVDSRIGTAVSGYQYHFSDDGNGNDRLDGRRVWGDFWLYVYGRCS